MARFLYEDMYCSSASRYLGRINPTLLELNACNPWSPLGIQIGVRDRIWNSASRLCTQFPLDKMYSVTLDQDERAQRATFLDESLSLFHPFRCSEKYSTYGAWEVKRAFV